MSYCKAPDRHCPGMLCGYPIPCPYHTVVIDLAEETIRIPARNAEAILAADKLIAVANALVDVKKGAK